LLLYSAGFIRNELKFGDYDQRMMAVEEIILKLKDDSDGSHDFQTAKTSNKGGMSRTIRLALIEYLTDSSLFFD